MNTGAQKPRPIVIAHRGASGYLPEHTLAAYSVAMLQGADFIEPDLVMTKDRQLIARHDNVLNLTTDVASHREFADRKTTKVVDGIEITGWFSEDFTLQEIKQLRAVERIPGVRPCNTLFNGQFAIPTLEEIVYLTQAMERALRHKIGIYPETKHPTYFGDLGLSMAEPLVAILRRNGYEEDRRDRVFIQSFEVGNLEDLDRITTMPLVQLLWLEGKPYDVKAAGGALTYEQMATPEGLKRIAQYADGVGPEKYHFVMPRNAAGNLDPANATRFVADAHAAGLLVHPYTFRAENEFLPTNLQSLAEPTARGDSAMEVKVFLATGIDGFFIDQPNIGVQARSEFLREN